MNLFYGRFLSEYLTEQTSRALQAVEKIDAAELVDSFDDVVRSTVDRFTPPPLNVRSGDAYAKDPQEVKRAAPTAFGGHVTLRGSLVQFFVPFEGRSEMLDLRPNLVTGGGIEAQVAKQEILIAVVSESSDAKIFEAEYKRRLGDVETHVARINNQVFEWRPGMEKAVKNRAEQRRKSVTGTRSLVRGLTIPVRSSAAAPVAIPVEPKPLLIERAKRVREEPAHEPQLADKVAEEVVQRIVGFGRALERLPVTAGKFSETEIRDVLLFVLNSNFEGLARAEVFNGNGKTDILLPYENRNAFIGECKFWEGAAKFEDALNQLLGYLVWRDTRAALLVFIREGAPTKVIAEADDVIQRHSHFVSASSAAEDDGAREYVVRSTIDADRQIRLALIPFVLQTPEKIERKRASRTARPSGVE